MYSGRGAWHSFAFICCCSIGGLSGSLYFFGCLHLKVLSPTIVTSAESMLVLDYVLHSTTKNLLSLVYSLSDLVSIHPPEGWEATRKAPSSRSPPQNELKILMKSGSQDWIGMIANIKVRRSFKCVGFCCYSCCICPNNFQLSSGSCCIKRNPMRTWSWWSCLHWKRWIGPWKVAWRGRS